MATIRDITQLCKEGKVGEGYDLAKADLEEVPTDVWKQRAMGWALYYSIRQEAEARNLEGILTHIEELKTLDQLEAEGDKLIYDQVAFKLGDYIKNKMPKAIVEASPRLSALFLAIREIEFQPSKGYSYLLQSVLEYGEWYEFFDFLVWWDLSKLLEEDYHPFVLQTGNKLMALAERVYIAYAKALLKMNDPGKIEEFLPLMDALMTKHPEMLYPGYFYGRLLLALGSNREEALKVIVPFAQKKASEFWVWQLLSDVFDDDLTMRLACLLRSVNCRTQEDFLGKVRIKLASLFVQQQQYDYARYHIDAVVRCYTSKGWRLPREIEEWIHQSWINEVKPNAGSPVDYMKLTNEILYDGAKEGVAIVTYVNPQNHRVSMIYGEKKRLSQKLRFKVDVGTVLKIYYIIEADGRPKILNAQKAKGITPVSYIKTVEGRVERNAGKDFAFLKCGAEHYFLPPMFVKKYNVGNDEQMRCVVTLDFDQKKDKWSWVAVRKLKS